MSETDPIENTEDIIDSRDVIARIAYLEAQAKLRAEDEGIALNDALDEAETAELVALQALETGAEGHAPDWLYGEALIRDTYFEDHARQLAEDIGAVPDVGTWPSSYIDWERAAAALQQDYTSVEFDGVTYWIR